jgi:hypothetical protein
MAMADHKDCHLIHNHQARLAGKLQNSEAERRATRVQPPVLSRRAISCVGGLLKELAEVLDRPP